MKKRITFLCFFILASIAFAIAETPPQIKPPNVSGQFYPAHPKELQSFVEELLSKSKNINNNSQTSMIIVPHAGYVYSGAIAAQGYNAVRNNQYSTIIVLGSSHYFAFDGASVWMGDGMETPLGVSIIDHTMADDIVKYDSTITFNPDVFEKEHSLEVQLPFIQTLFPKAKIVPILMGRPNPEVSKKLAIAMHEAIGAREDVLLVVSTDFSHYHAGNVAREMDLRTLEAIKAHDIEHMWNEVVAEKMEMCGFTSVITGLLFAQMRGLNSVEVLNYAHSGDVIGNHERVVGYATITFQSSVVSDQGLEKVSSLNIEQKRKLVEIARKTVDEFVKTGKAPVFDIDDPRLKHTEGAFVTLHKNGVLRGCIGHIIGQGPLYETVRQVAISAASQDPRFSPVTQEELNDIDVEVSVLSLPQKVKGVKDIEMGKHGVILSKGWNHRGVFLPQVATETGWSKQEFMSQLASQKAGLARDAWKDPSVTLEIFTADVFDEEGVGLDHRP